MRKKLISLLTVIVMMAGVVCSNPVSTYASSGYTVEFTYDDLQYVLQGDSRVELSEILDTVGIEVNDDITEVIGSNDSLFKPVNEDGTWYIETVKAFTSKEWLKVKIGEAEYEIVVTDDTTSPGSGNFEPLEVKSGFNIGLIAPQGATGTQLNDASNYGGFTGDQSWSKFGGIASYGYLRNTCGKTDEVATQYGVPDDGKIVDISNSNLYWQLAPYTYQTKNAMRLYSGNTTGSFTFSKIGCYQNVWFLTTGYTYGWSNIQGDPIV